MMSTELVIDDQTKLFITQAGVVLLGDTFSIPNNTETAYVLLYNYFSANLDHKYKLISHKICKDNDIDPSKGILLAGSIGSGKTVAMKVMKIRFKGFRIISTRHVVRDFELVGSTALDNYGRKSFKVQPSGAALDHKNPITYCFDDIGHEDNEVIRYGQKYSPMADILTDRYENFIEYEMITHGTTNLTFKELEALYGNRVSSRIKEMFNIIPMTGDDLRQ